ncbi:hypothetical protein AAD001_17045 [Colwelliaceae bacterium 6471]
MSRYNNPLISDSAAETIENCLYFLDEPEVVIISNLHHNWLTDAIQTCLDQHKDELSEVARNGTD